MKKIYLLMVCAGMAFVANAQNVKFYEGTSKVIPQNSTYTFNTAIEDFAGMLLHPDITLKADASTSITVTTSCTTGQEIELCFDGGCKSGTNVTSSVVTMTKGKSYPLDYKYESNSFDPINYVVSTVVTVKDDITESVVNEITVTYDPNMGGVIALATDSSFRYANDVITYNAETPTALSIYNAEGRTMAKTVMNGSGSISLADFAPGVYIYVAGNKSGKLLVK